MGVLQFGPIGEPVDNPCYPGSPGGPPLSNTNQRKENEGRTADPRSVRFLGPLSSDTKGEEVRFDRDLSLFSKRFVA